MKLVLLACVVACAAIGCINPSANPKDLHPFGPKSGMNHPINIPTDGLPKGELQTNFNSLLAAGLFNRDLRLKDQEVPWSASFFPTWFGGISGRWQDGKLKLLWRTLTGPKFLEPEEARNLVEASAKGDASASRRLFRLSPTEKYDLIEGDYEFHLTRLESRLRGHEISNLFRWVPFWSGYCNGVVVASVYHREPFREVEVIGRDGITVRFHPNDVKALLALAYLRVGRKAWNLGLRCNDLSLDSEVCKDVNPASFVIALINRIGIARKAFMIDKNPLQPVINVAVGEGRVDITRPPYEPPQKPPKGVSSLVDVRITLGVNSTQEGYDAMNLRTTISESPLVGAYQPSPFPAERLTYHATLALDRAGEIVGGAWAPPEMSGPDFAWGMNDTMNQVQNLEGHLWANGFLRWEIVDRLYQKSISQEPKLPQLDLRRLENVDRIFAFFEPSTEVKLRQGEPARFFAFLGGKALKDVEMMTVHAGADERDSPNDVYVTSVRFTEEQRRQSSLVFDLEVEIPKKGNSYLKARLFRRGREGLHPSDTIVSKLVDYR